MDEITLREGYEQRPYTVVWTNNKDACVLQCKVRKMRWFCYKNEGLVTAGKIDWTTKGFQLTEFVEPNNIIHAFSVN